ncbi:hypothetical protein HWV62_9159 [Athelia sp. TMB]|nr:hypothetical protein HWV62_9159 [Athelia sp. TMB]
MVLRRRGISIGDVGIIRPDGSFQYVFNIFAPRPGASRPNNMWDTEEPPINYFGVPNGFEPLPWNPDLELECDENKHSQESELMSEGVAKHVVNASIDASMGDGSSTLRLPVISVRYTASSCSTETAVLTMPDGARGERYRNTQSIQDYTEKNAKSWYNFINGEKGLQAPNGSIYVVTACDKATAWGIATAATNDSSHSASFKFTAVKGVGAGASYLCSWSTSSGTVSRHSTESNLGPDMRQPHNQCLFIKGMKVMIRDSPSKIIKGPVKVERLEEFSKPKDLQRVGKTFPGAGSGYSAGTGRLSGSTQHLSGSQNDNEETEMADDWSDILELYSNSGTLQTGADVAIAQEEDWWILSPGPTLATQEEILRRIPDHYKPVGGSHAAFLEPIGTWTTLSDAREGGRSAGVAPSMAALRNIASSPDRRRSRGSSHRPRSPPDTIAQSLGNREFSSETNKATVESHKHPMRGPSREPSPGVDPNLYSQTLIKEEDSDGDDDLWQTKPTEKNSSHASAPRAPSLKVVIDQRRNDPPPSSFHHSVPLARAYGGQRNRPLSPTDSSSLNLRPPLIAAKAGHRGNTFADSEQTWAPRPTHEEIYEKLEDFFPEHNPDTPVIETGSGVGHPTAPLPEQDKSDENRIRKAKKSIRIVAEEHKKKIDRISRASVRKRSTKLWGSRMEDITTEQATSKHARTLDAASSLVDSSSGGSRPIFKWVRGELIGKGTYGRVYLALNTTTGEMIAVKQVEIPKASSDKAGTKQAGFVKAFKSESGTLEELDHPNVVQYLGFEETPNFLSIFMEYVPGGSIGSCLAKHGKFEEEVTKSFAGQILTGLEYLHSKNILHRDLKADNILVEKSGVCKIADFGISKRTGDIHEIGELAEMMGSVFWMAPEVIDTPEKGYDKKVDIWSVGCVVLDMWAGKRPCTDDEAMTAILKVCGGRLLLTVQLIMDCLQLHKSKLPPPIPDNVILSPMAHNFKNLCFAINPEDRPTAAVLRKHLYLVLPPDWHFTGFGSSV